jgi:hypothetical protein
MPVELKPKAELEGLSFRSDLAKSHRYLKEHHGSEPELPGRY